MAIIVQARMSSKRLPGKMLIPINGTTLLERVVARLETVARKLGLPIWVATSSEASDEPLRDRCERLGVNCYAGPLDDVSLRFLNLARSEGFPFFVRISGDSPLIHESIVEKAVELYRNSDCTMITNVFPRTFPPGQSVEVFDTSRFDQAYPGMTATEREHLGMHFYNRSRLHKIVNFSTEIEFEESASMTVDTKEDLHVVEALFSSASEDDVKSMCWKDLARVLSEIRGTLRYG